MCRARCLKATHFLLRVTRVFFQKPRRTASLPSPIWKGACHRSLYQKAARNLSRAALTQIYQAVQPPSTVILEPVIKVEASLASSTSAPQSSSGWPKRFIIVFLDSSSLKRLSP